MSQKLLLIESESILIIGLIVLGLGLMFWAVQSRKDGSIEDLGERLGLEVIELSDGPTDVPDPALRGTIENYKVSILTSQERGGRYGSKRPYTAVRVYTNRNSDFEFEVAAIGEARQLLENVVSPDIITGHAEFDRHYRVLSNREDMMQAVLDQFICEDFAANKESLYRCSFEYKHGFLFYTQFSHPDTKARMERLEEIALFMVHLAQKIDSVAKKNQ